MCCQLPNRSQNLRSTSWVFVLDRPGDRFLGLRPRPVRQVVPRLDLLHRPSFGPRKKPQRIESISEAPSPTAGAVVGAAQATVSRERWTDRKAGAILDSGMFTSTESETPGAAAPLGGAPTFTLRFRPTLDPKGNPHERRSRFRSSQALPPPRRARLPPRGRVSRSPSTSRFTIERGECVAILGQNGSGKSTLVRLLATLLLADGGSAEVFGHDVVREARAVRRLVNRVSVEASFFKRMSSAENLSYAARFYGLTARETRSRIPEILGGSGSRPSAAGSRWRTSRAACSRRWRSRGRS